MPTAYYYNQNPRAPKPNQLPRLNAVMVVEAENHILLEHRKDTFTWGLLSGDIDFSETFKQCLVRIGKEKAGIRINQNHLESLGLFDDPLRIVSYLNGNVCRIITEAYGIQKKKMVNLKCSERSIELRWIPMDEIKRYELIATHEDILNTYLEKNRHLQRAVVII